MIDEGTGQQAPAAMAKFDWIFMQTVVQVWSVCAGLFLARRKHERGAFFASFLVLLLSCTGQRFAWLR